MKRRTRKKREAIQARRLRRLYKTNPLVRGVFGVFAHSLGL